MKKEQVSNCQFSVWYPIFKKYTIKSLILPLPQNVIEYLLDDGTLVVSGSHSNTAAIHTNSDSDTEEDIQLVTTCRTKISCLFYLDTKAERTPQLLCKTDFKMVVQKTTDQRAATWSDDETTTTVTAPEFPEFTSKVLEAINALGGSVFPKLNWSAPRDANWIALNSSLQCHSLSDIFLLFKSSDFITHDLTQPFLQCSDEDSPDPVINYEMVLRKWSELIPGGEFRCFVKENKLIAISQRDYTQYYQHVLKQEQQISQAIQEFFSQHIQYNFLDEDFVFDVYRDSQGRVWLIDVNPFGEVTDSLLFSWAELMSGGEVAQQHQDGPAFRHTTSEVTVQPSPCLSYRIPRDFIDLSTGEDAFKLIDFLKLTKSQQEESDEEEEEETAPQ